MKMNLKQLFHEFTAEFWREHVLGNTENDREFLLKLYFDKFHWTFNITPPIEPRDVERYWDELSYDFTYKLEKENLVKMGVPCEYL